MKTVMLIDKELPIGLVANTAAVLGISLGAFEPDIVGPNVQDGEGQEHKGITHKTIPILGGTKEIINLIRNRVCEDEFSEVQVIDFSDVAQTSLDYDLYTSRMRGISGERLAYLGLCLYGPDKKINKLTGSIGLLR